MDLLFRWQAVRRSASNYNVPFDLGQSAKPKAKIWNVLVVASRNATRLAILRLESQIQDIILPHPRHQLR